MARSKRKDARATEDAILALGNEIYQLTKAEIGERTGKKEDAIGAAMRRLGIIHDGDAISRSRIKHGTTGAWMYRKCRCDICIEARRDYKRREWQKRQESFRWADYEHGKTETYSAGCDCEKCAEAMRIYLLQRNQRTQDTARAMGKRWTGPEVEHAIRDDLSIEQIAADLGRTYAAVSNVRKSIAAGEPRYLSLLGDRPYKMPAWIGRHDNPGRTKPAPPDQ